MPLKGKRWYYSNERYYPYLFDEEKRKEAEKSGWFEKEYNYFPREGEYDGRDIKTLPLIFGVFLEDDVKSAVRWLLKKVDEYVRDAKKNGDWDGTISVQYLKEIVRQAFQDVYP